MGIISHPTVARIFLVLVRPFRRWIPSSLHIPVAGPVVVDLPGGKRITLIGNPTCFVCKKLYWEGFEGFESEWAELFLRMVQRARSFVDAGAHIGYYSILAATYNQDIQIYSFEPNPEIRHYLLKNIEENHLSRVVVHGLALSNRTGTATLTLRANPKFPDIDADLSGMSTITGDAGEYTDLRSFNVAVTTLDELSREAGWETVDLVKLDAEGSEDMIIEGALDTLRRDKPVIYCEVLPNRIEKRLEALFASLGYGMFKAVRDRLEPVISLRHRVTGGNDYIMVHPERSELVRGIHPF